ncbi:MAG: hypothetical protein JNL92_08850 [Opitutaceae bacterium]|nr:hypothetical protein [Opitutaceae bacterium]
MSFSCPHFEPDQDFCHRLKTDCVPGRPGCVLGAGSVFAVPVEERIRAKEAEKRRNPELYRTVTRKPGT